jgi:hypothetical protein
MRDAVDPAKRRIERATETLAAVARAKVDPSPENIAALHRLHAEHRREDGDLAGAARAEERATRAEAMVQR